MTSFKNSLYLTYLFARSYWLATGLISAVCVVTYWLHGPPSLNSLIYFKLITSAILMASNYRRKFPNDVFYLNFGMSLRRLVTAAVSSDLLVWLVAMVHV